MKKFARFTKNYNKFTFLFATTELLAKKTRFLCTVSGGQDSIVTVFILFHLLSISKHLYKKDTFLDGFLRKEESNFIYFPQKLFTQKKQNKKFKLPIVQILYCQHFWQPKNFFCSEFLFQLTVLLDIPYTLILPKSVLASENRSREWRKKNFYRFLELEKLETLVTGLTKSDNLEKNLTNLLRGTSPKSLSNEFLLSDKKTSNMFFCFRLFKPIFFYSSIKQIKHAVGRFFFYTEKNQKEALETHLVIFERKKNKVNSFWSQQKSYFQDKRLPDLDDTFQFSKFCLIRKKSIGPLTKNFFRNNKVFQKSLKKRICAEKINSSSFSAPKTMFLGKKSLLKIEKNVITFFFKKQLKSRLVFCKKIAILEMIQFDFFYFTETFKIEKINSKNVIFYLNCPWSGSFCFSTKNMKNQKLLLKPLEEISRSTVSKFVNLYQFPISSDITNFDVTFSRNKIRHYYIPFIRIFFKIKFEKFLTTFFYIVGDEHKNVEYTIFELKMVLKFLQGKSFQQILQNSFSITLSSQIQGSIKNSFLQNSLSNYKELELNYEQISQLTTFIN
jgi:tRNA(Ile)-lysidine synthase TilS/MesJ